MSSISAVGTSTATPLVQSFSLLDTNEDGFVTPPELAAVLTPDEEDNAGLPTTSAAATLTDQVASAMLDVQTTDASASSVSSFQDALAAYVSEAKEG